MDRTIEIILRKLITMALQLCLPLIPKSYACPKWCGHSREEMVLRLRCALAQCLGTYPVCASPTVVPNTMYTHEHMHAWSESCLWLVKDRSGLEAEAGGQGW